MTQYVQIPEADRILDKLYSEQHATYSQSEKIGEYVKSFARSLSALDNNKNGIILEIGCNDGSLLSEFKFAYDRDVLGVEPGKSFTECWHKQGIPVVNTYFDEVTANQLTNKKFSIIIIRHVLEHIPDPLYFLSQVARLMDDDTTLVIESPYLLSVIKDGRYENLSYSHLNHFTIRALSTMVGTFGLGISCTRLVDTDGGSFVAEIRRGIQTKIDLLDHMRVSDLKEFLARMMHHGEELKKRLERYLPGEVIGYGAGAKGPHLLSLYDIHRYIPIVVDDNPSYQGKYIAGTGSVIRGSEVLHSDKIKLVVNLAPTHTESIRKRIPDQIELIDVI